MNMRCRVLAGLALVLAPFARARANLPTCAAVMQFGVDCQIGNAVTGGITLTGFSQLFGPTGYGVTYNAGGTIGFDLLETSESASRLRMSFDAASVSALYAYSSSSYVSGNEVLSFAMNSIGGSVIETALLGRGNGSNPYYCGQGGSGQTGCGSSSWSVSQTINGQTVGSATIALGASSLAIGRTSTVSASGGPVVYLYSYQNACGRGGSWPNYYTRYCWQPVSGQVGSAEARSPDQWVYEFDLQGTGPASVPGTTVPEPSSVILLAAGLLGLLAARRTFTPSR